MEVPRQSPKGLRVATRCNDVEQFVRSFHRFCEDSGVFILHARRSVGEVIAFSFDLTDGSPALRGLGAVIEQFATPDNRFGRPGIFVAMHRLTRNTKRVFQDLMVARASSKEPASKDELRSPTPVPLAQPRGVTAIVRLVDPETLTPPPGVPPRSPDARRTRTQTPPIARVPTKQPIRQTQARVKVLTVGVPDSPVRTPLVAAVTAEATGVAAAAYSDPLAEQADATVVQTDPVAEQTARMATPPAGVLALGTADEPMVTSPAEYESTPIEEPTLPPPPIVFPGLPPASSVAMEPVAAFAGSAPAVLAVASAHPAPVPAFMPAPGELAPSPGHPSSPQRWATRKIWLVASFAGASLFVLGIVIGATVIGGGTQRAKASLERPPARSEPQIAPPLAAAAAAAAAQTPPAPPSPTIDVAAPRSAAPTPPPVAPVPAPAAAAPTIVKRAPARPATPAKKPVRTKRHKHESHSSGCTSLKCL